MSEHAQSLSYAMRNSEATQQLMHINTPSQLHDWSYLAIEGMIFAGFLLALFHAYRSY